MNKMRGVQNTNTLTVTLYGFILNYRVKRHRPCAYENTITKNAMKYINTLVDKSDRNIR